MNNSPHEILTSIAGAIRTSILDLLGESSVESIFLSGGAAEGRIAWFDDGGFMEIYSDLDIFVVVAPGVDCAAAKSAARSVIPGLPLETKSYTVFRAPDIGVYTEDELLSQPDRPGTVEIPKRFRMLYGREDIVERTRRFDASNIDREEALYLLENRLMEEASLRARPVDTQTDGCARSAFYASLKHCLDAVSAVLIAEGAFVCGLDDRMKLFRSRSAVPGFVLGKESLDLIDYACRHLGNLQEAMRSESGRFDDVQRRSEELLLTAWKAVAASIFESAPSGGWEELLRMRCGARSLESALRESVVVSRRCGKGLRTGVSLWCRYPKIRPTAALRLSGLCEIMGELGDAKFGTPPGRLVAYLNSMTSSLGFSDGSLFNRTRELSRRLS